MWPLIDQLAAQGVRDFALSPGSRSTPLAIALSRHPHIRLHRHFDERGLGFYALGCALGGERPTALVTTSGTAVGNLLPAVMEAHHASIPMLLLTADRPPELREVSANQTSDQLKIFQNFVRWQFDLDPTMPERAIRSKAAQAVFRAMYPHPGPVHINCPFREPLYPPQEVGMYTARDSKIGQWQGGAPNLSQAQADAEAAKLKKFSDAGGLKGGGCPTQPEPIFESRAVYGHPIVLNAAAFAPLPPRMLPEKGIILVGRSPKQSEIREILALANRLQWPVFADILSSARIEPTPEQIKHFDWIVLNRPPTPDCILHFGERLTSKRLMEWLAASPPASYIHVSPSAHWCDPWQLQTERIYASIEAACAAFTCTSNLGWLASWQTLDAQTSTALMHERSIHFTERDFVQMLNALPLRQWAIFLANSMPIREGDWFLFPAACQGFFANRGLSGIDGNIATVAGLSKGLQKPVLAILGDLATLHDLNSLALLRDAPHPIILLVSNNDGCGIFSHFPVATDPHFETLFGFAHGFTFEAAAKMFHIPYAFADRAETAELAVQTALETGRTCLIEIKTSREHNIAHHRMLRKAVAEIHETV